MTSSNSSSEISLGGLDYATFVYDHRIYRGVFLSGLVILVYDHLLTLGSEIKFMWRRRFHFGAYWFLAVRYISLACSLTITVFYFGHLSTKTCSKIQRLLEALLMLQQAFVEMTLGLRVLAMYGLNPWVGLPMGILGAVAAGLGLWTMVEYGAPQMLTVPGLPGYHTVIPKSTALLLAAVWEAQVALDTLVFGLTLYRAYMDRSTVSMISGSLIRHMMRDGAMYFGIIVFANVADVLTIYLGDEMISGILSWWTTSLSVTLISRLNLNLQRAGIGNSGTDDQGTTEIDEIHFITPNAPPVRRDDDDLGSLFDDV
ncbi:hypothetical protein C8F04DRAFT_1126729 [Mycena alexandri]|uniref:DUF6533 domain-containing protein n=1 Tax=Mycena alexandri TaxID=1745969 RepID=A0AAD6RZF6_9AGAR|nr:hypothetical protein C8F04DRAFT_1152459 [Mycena alexandri]KAJ7025915.1 hypothetical protein C8F04DRAFT_1126729 [Mycena alexandri]